MDFSFFLNLLSSFVYIKLSKIDKKGRLKKHKEEVVEEPKEPETKTCPYCLTDVKYHAKRCPHCTSELVEEVEKV